MFVRETPLSEDSDYAVEVRAHAGQADASQEASRRGLIRQAQSYAQFVAKRQDRVTVAGVGVVAANTGRVLLIQRSNEDVTDPARGLWELPGGHLDAGESPWEAAQREWSEETGITFPAEGHLAGNWISNGLYQAHLFVIPAENAIDLHPDGKERVGNPDDKDGTNIESCAWWELEHIVRSNKSLRREFVEGLDRGLVAKVIREAQDDAEQPVGEPAGG